MNIYIAEINEVGLTYGFIYIVKAKNKKEAKEKVYRHCYTIHAYKKKDIIVKSLDELFEDEWMGGDVVEVY